MRKRTYRAKNINEINAQRVSEGQSGRVVFAIDVAKEVCYGRLMATGAEPLASVKWNQLTETRALLRWLGELEAAGLEVQVPMEASGTYSDALRYQLEKAGFAVFRVSGKRCHDAQEVFDGVPSLHDGKAADILARLHLQGLSSRWTDEDQRRELNAAAQLCSMHGRAYQETLNRVEGLLGRYWPELTRHLGLTSATLLALLAQMGGPEEVVAQPQLTRRLMRQSGGQLLRRQTIEAVIESALTTIGKPMVAQELELLRHTAAEADRHRKLMREFDKRLEELSKGKPEVQYMGAVVGVPTAAVLVANLGNPRNYSSAAAYVKAMGLNLKIKSSGKYTGQLKITKRGPSEVRRLLYLAVLRLIQQTGDPAFRAWYLSKVKREGGKRKKKAVVALTRKLAAALWHVAAGAPFESERLFDLRRLGVVSAIAA